MMQDWLAGLVGEDLAPILFVVLAALFVAVLAILVIRLLRGVLTGGIGLRNSEGPRVEVVDVTAVDPKRKLVLVRRDQVEHLILIGGANDLVIESRIGRPAPPPPRRIEPDTEIAAVPAPSVSRPEMRRPDPSVGASGAPAPRPTVSEPVRSAQASAVAPAVRAPQPQVATPAISASPVRASEDGGRRVEPDLASEPPRVRIEEPPVVNAPSPMAGERRNERPAASTLPQAAPVAMPLPTERAPMATPVALQPPLPPRPAAPSIAAPVAAPPVDPQLRVPERRPAPAQTSMPQAPTPPARPAAEAPMGPIPSSTAPTRHPVPEWPVRDTAGAPAPERANASMATSPAAAAPKISSPVAAEERPLVVRSFASTISERRSGPVTPVPPVAAAPAPESVRPATPPSKPAVEASDRDLDDDLLTDLSRQLELSDEADGLEAAPAAKGTDPAPGAPARGELSLEDEMQRLLRDFSAHTGDRR